MGLRCEQGIHHNPNECFVSEVIYVLDGLVYVRTDRDYGADTKTEVSSSVKFN